MTTFSNSLLQEQDYRTRIKTIPWDAYQRASILSQQDLALLQKVSGHNRSKQDVVWAEETANYAALYVRLLDGLSRNDALHPVLVAVGDMLNDHEGRIRFFLSPAPSDGTPTTPYPTLLKLVQSKDGFVRLKATTTLSTFIALDRTPPEDAVLALVDKIAGLVESSDSDEQEIGIQCLQQALRRPSVRIAVWNAEGLGADSVPAEGEAQAKTYSILSSLVGILKGKRPSPQMQYQVGFCFWLLTFEHEIAANLNKSLNVLPALIDLARVAVKEKIIRVVIATFRNLATLAPGTNLAYLVGSGDLLPFVKNLATRKWTDDEVKDDIEWLRDTLMEAKKNLTTYDEYSSELHSGRLRWSPPHTSDEFWRENAAKLNDKDHAQVKALINLLSAEDSDATVLAVAAHDLTQYVKHCDMGKRVADRLGAKPMVMKLMSHPNADVQYEALVGVQLLVSQPWAA